MTAVNQVALTDHEVDIIIEALYEHARIERSRRPRTAAAIGALRRRLLVQRIAEDGGIAWGWRQPTLPLEST